VNEGHVPGVVPLFDLDSHGLGVTGDARSDVSQTDVTESGVPDERDVHALSRGKRRHIDRVHRDALVSFEDEDARGRTAVRVLDGRRDLCRLSLGHGLVGGRDVDERRIGRLAAAEHRHAPLPVRLAGLDEEFPILIRPGVRPVGVPGEIHRRRFTRIEGALGRGDHRRRRLVCATRFEPDRPTYRLAADVLHRCPHGEGLTGDGLAVARYPQQVELALVVRVRVDSDSFELASVVRGEHERI